MRSTRRAVLVAASGLLGVAGLVVVWLAAPAADAEANAGEYRVVAPMIVANAAPAATPTPPSASFGPGRHMVGSAIQAGTYRARTPGASCYWERLSGLGGGLGDIIANGLPSGSPVVSIAPSDVAFDSSGCGTWTSDLAPMTASTTADFGAGTWIIGTDIAAGTWRAKGGDSSCYWERLSGFGGTLNQIIANEFGNPKPVVAMAGGDAGFYATANCGTWTRDLSSITESPTNPFGAGTWIVGVDVAPGMWQAAGSDDSCYWARVSGFGGTLAEIIANSFGDANPAVTIDASDAGFTTTAGCGIWVRVGVG